MGKKEYFSNFGNFISGDAGFYNTASTVKSS